MTNCLFGWPNRFAYGGIVVSAADNGLGGDQLANDQGNPSAAWQAPYTIAAVSLTIPVADVWGAGSIHRANLTTAALLRWRVWAGTDQTAAPVYDTGAISAGIFAGYGQSVTFFPPATIGRTLRLDISDPTNPDGFINIPQAFGGPVWQTTRNYGYASSIIRNEQTTTTRTRAGGELIRNDWQQRGFDIVFGAITPAEVLTLVQLDAQARLGGNILFVPNPQSPALNAQAIFGRLTPTAPIGFANNSARTRTWRATATERL